MLFTLLADAHRCRVSNSKSTVWDAHLLVDSEPRWGFAPAKSDDLQTFRLKNFFLSMPNKDQLLFVFSFIGTLSSLILGSRLLISYLRPQDPDPDSWTSLFLMAWAPGDSSVQFNQLLSLVTGLVGTVLFVFYINSKSVSFLSFRNLITRHPSQSVSQFWIPKNGKNFH